MIRLNRSKFGNWPSGPRSHCNLFMPGFMGGGGGLSLYNIPYSLRLRAAANATMERQFGSGGNDLLWTLNFNVKRGLVDAANRTIIGWGTSGDYGGIRFNSSFQLEVYRFNGSFQYQLITNALYRDPSGHMNVNLRYDSGNATTASRIILEVNGTAITSFATASYPSLNVTSRNLVNAAYFTIGATSNTGGPVYFDGLVSDVRLVSGQSLPAIGNFLEISPTTGQPVPKRYAGTYGTQGGYWPFKNATSAAALGYDYQTEARSITNDLTPSNISVSAGTSLDQSSDTPTNNLATLSPINNSGTNVSNANLTWGHGAAAYYRIGATQAITIPTYFEVEVPYVGGGGHSTYFGVGAREAAGDYSSYFGSQSDSWSTGYSGGSGFLCYLTNNGTQTNPTGNPSFTTTTRIKCAVNPVTGKIWWGVAGSSWYNSGDPAAGTNAIFSGLPSTLYAFFDAYNLTGINVIFDPIRFMDTPPTGFKSLSTANLSTPSIPNPRSRFNVVTWTGDGSVSRDITGVGFKPGLVWAKQRSAARDNWLVDAARGTPLGLVSNSTAVESSDATAINSLLSDGFRLGNGSSSWIGVNGNTQTFAAFCFKLSDTPVSNTQGSITSSVIADQTAGMSLYTYTGNASSGATVGHGLGVAPELNIIKSRSVATSWYIWHKNLTGPTYQMNFDTAAETTVPGITGLNNKAPTSSVIELPGTGYGTNNNAATYVGLAFASIPGFSKVGVFLGNGSTDGNFVYTGFKPRWIMARARNAAGSWSIYDRVRSGTPLLDAIVWADLTQAESNPNGNAYEVSQFGFKPRTSAGMNTNGVAYLYIAIADAPGKYANAG